MDVGRGEDYKSLGGRRCDDPLARDGPVQNALDGRGGPHHTVPYNTGVVIHVQVPNPYKSGIRMVSIDLSNVYCQEDYAIGVCLFIYLFICLQLFNISGFKKVFLIYVFILSIAC